MLWRRTNPRPKRRSDDGLGESGAVVVEFALLAPVLLLILTGMIVFGLVLNQYIMLWNGVGVGAAQFAITGGGASSTPATAAVTAIVNSAPTLTAANISVTLTVGSNTACFSGTAASSTSAGDTACSAQLQANAGNPAVVLATYPCTLTVMQYDFFPNCQLSAQVTELVE
jgi:Flp pilus assembly protein TadG